MGFFSSLGRIWTPSNSIDKDGEWMWIPLIWEFWYGTNIRTRCGLNVALPSCFIFIFIPPAMTGPNCSGDRGSCSHCLHPVDTQVGSPRMSHWLVPSSCFNWVAKLTGIVLFNLQNIPLSTRRCSLLSFILWWFIFCFYPIWIHLGWWWSPMIHFSRWNGTSWGAVMRDILGFERLQDLAQSLERLQCVNFSIHVPGIKTKYKYTFRWSALN